MMCRQAGQTRKSTARPVFHPPRPRFTFKKEQYFPLYETSDICRGFLSSSKRRAKTAVRGAA
jgi:hypothetical protein